MNGRRLALRALLVAVTVGCILGVIAVFGGLSKTMERALETSVAVSVASLLAMSAFSAWDLRSALLFSRLGAVCSILGGVLAIASIWTESGSDLGARVVGTVCILALAGAVGSLVELARLTAPQRWLRLGLHGVGTVLIAGVLAVVWEVAKDSGGTAQVLGALTIVYASGTIGIMILHFLNRASAPEGSVAEVCFCPRCGKRLWVPAGDVQCKHCSSKFAIQLLLLACAACGGHSPPTTQLGNHADPEALPKLDGFADADLVAFDGRSVIAYSLAGNKVRRLGSLEATKVEADTPATWLAGDWADREHLFVHAEERRIVMITKAGMAPVQVPAAEKFKTPKPAQDDQMVEGGAGQSTLTGLVVDEGHAYWAECPWGYPYDGFQCAQYATAELWPDPAAEPAVGTEPEVPRSWHWEEAPPAGAAVKIGDGAAMCALGGVTTKFAGKADPEEIESTHWISAKPPRLLVIYGEPGYADIIPTRWSLHDGCSQKPLAEGKTVEPGPDGLWISTGSDEKTQTIHRRDQTLGDMPNQRVQFRPTK